MNLKPEARDIMVLLNKFGALTMPQVNKLFEGSNYNPNPTIAFLCKIRQIQYLDNNYVVLQNKPQYSIETLYCLWVMLDKISKNLENQGKTGTIINTMEVRTASACSNGMEVVFINSKKTAEYLTFIDKTTISKVSLTQDTFYVSTGVVPGKEKTCQRLYTFVVKDEETMEIIGDMNLTIPYQIAYIEGDLTGVPTIEYYELTEA